MFLNWQTPLALVVVALALAALARGVFSKRKKPGCGGGCGRPTDKFKANLKKVR
jgi:hypothetical protein